MPVSPAQAAKRALIRTLQALAAVYSLTLGLTSNSSDDEVRKAFKKTVVKAHPDKGGSDEHTQRLNAAKTALSQLPVGSSNKMMV